MLPAACEATTLLMRPLKGGRFLSTLLSNSGFEWAAVMWEVRVTLVLEGSGSRVGGESNTGAEGQQSCER